MKAHIVEFMCTVKVSELCCIFAGLWYRISFCGLSCILVFWIACSYGWNYQLLLKCSYNCRGNSAICYIISHAWPAF